MLLLLPPESAAAFLPMPLWIFYAFYINISSFWSVIVEFTSLGLFRCSSWKGLVQWRTHPTLVTTCLLLKLDSDTFFIADVVTLIAVLSSVSSSIEFQCLLVITDTAPRLLPLSFYCCFSFIGFGSDSVPVPHTPASLLLQIYQSSRWFESLDKL